jgi:hypothetical protein
VNIPPCPSSQNPEGNQKILPQKQANLGIRLKTLPPGDQLAEAVFYQFFPKI